MSFQDLKDQSTLKSFMSDVWLTCDGVMFIRSNTGVAGMISSFGENLEASVSCDRVPYAISNSERKTIADLYDHFIELICEAKLTINPTDYNTPLGDFYNSE